MKLTCSLFLSMWLFVGFAHAQGVDELAIAIVSGNPSKAQAVLDAGVDVNADLGEGRTPLITAVMLTQPDMVRFLLANGAQANRKTGDGAIGNALSTAFFGSAGMAILRRDDEEFGERRVPAIECLRLVAASKPDFNILVSRGPTRVSPLMMAAEAGVPDALRILLNAGASPNFANDGKYTALDYAVDRAPRFAQISESDRAEVVRLLLAAGAQKDKKGADGLTPLERARKAGNHWAIAALTG